MRKRGGAHLKEGDDHTGGEDASPDAKRSKTTEDSTPDPTAAQGDNNSKPASTVNPTALAADIAAALPMTMATAASTTTTTASNTNNNATTATKEETPEEAAARKKIEIQAALEQVKEENLKQQPSISTLVTEGLWGDDARVVEHALTEIANLSFGNANAGPNRVTISLTGGLLAIVKALQRFSTDAEVQAAGGRALQNLALDQNNKSGLASAGGIDVMIQAMREFPLHEGVQLGGAGTFQNLVWGNDDNRWQLYKAGAVPVLLQAMTVHQDSVELNEWACGAIYLLSVGEKEIKDSLMEHKALSILALALEKHRDEGGIMEKGRNALARLLWP